MEQFPRKPARDDGFRSVAFVVAALGALAFLSFVMAGVVGEREKSDHRAASAHHSVNLDKSA